MRKLPHWVLTDKFPAFYDSESATSIQQTAKVYAAMQELIEEYNKFVDEINNQLETFENETNAKNECFRNCITKTLNDYIVSIDMKKDELEAYMKTNLEATAKKLLDEIIADLNATIEQFKADRELLLAGFEAQNKAIDQQNNVLASAINRMDSTMDAQNARIEEIAAYLVNNLDASINKAVAKLIKDGEIVMGLSYNEETDALTFNARNVTYDTDLAVAYDASTESVRIYEADSENENFKKTYLFKDGAEVVTFAASTGTYTGTYVPTTSGINSATYYGQQSDGFYHRYMPQGRHGILYSTSKVNFDTQSKLCFLIDANIPTESGVVLLYACTSYQSPSESNILTPISVINEQIDEKYKLVEIDLTSVTGSGYIIIDSALATDEDTSLKIDVVVRDIWLE